MLCSLVLSLAIVTSQSDDDRAAYESAVAKAGPDARSQVQLALWCEARGLTAERMKHLVAAVSRDPSDAKARGLLGLVAYRGKWERPEDVAREAGGGPKQRALLDEYVRRRAQAPDKVEDQWRLALWCDQQGLKAQAIAHFHAVIRLDPRREAAWRHLGFKKVGNRWVKPEWQAAARREAEAQTRANRRWRPQLEHWRAGLASGVKGRQATAEAGLAGVTEPRAVPMVWAVFANSGTEGQRTAVRVLGQIDAPASSKALAILAISTGAADVRGEAIKILHTREPRDFAPLLVGMIQDPIKYQVKKVAGPGKAGELTIKDGSTNRKRVYTPLAEPKIALGPNDRVAVDPATGLPVVDRMVGYYQNPLQSPLSPQGAMAFMGVTPPPSGAQVAGILNRAGLPGAQSQQLGRTIAGNAASSYQMQMNEFNFMANYTGIGPNGFNLVQTETVQIPIGQMQLQARRSAEAAENQLEADVKALESHNTSVLRTNRLVRELLSEAIGVDKGDDRNAWTDWLADLLGFVLAERPEPAGEKTVVEEVPLSYRPEAAPIVVQQKGIGIAYNRACFGPGTPVRTMDGLHPIESIRPGDSVLAQDTQTGALRFEPVVEVHHNPPDALYHIALKGGEWIMATGIQRLWKAGNGWTMASALKPGDSLRTPGGLARVESVYAENRQPVYNLLLAEGDSYFAGKTGVLAHDSSMIKPVLEPFDAVVAPTVERPSPATQRMRTNARH